MGKSRYKSSGDRARDRHEARLEGEEGKRLYETQKEEEEKGHDKPPQE